MYYNLLPPDLVDRSIRIFTSELAWKSSDAKKVLLHLKNMKYIILGGDVVNHELKHTGDNWYYEPKNKKSSLSDINESYNVSFKYIEWYSKKFGTHFYYVIVAKKY